MDILISTDIVSDVRVRRLIRQHGAAAATVYVYLLADIGRAEGGYYMVWDDEYSAVDCAVQLGTTSDYVDKVLTCCLRLGLFHQDTFSEHHVLTSKGIQQRWLELFHLRRKRAAEVTVYNLLGDVSYDEQEIVERFMQSIFTLARLKRLFGLDEDELRQAMEEYLIEHRLAGTPITDSVMAKQGIIRWLEKKLNQPPEEPAPAKEERSAALVESTVSKEQELREYNQWSEAVCLKNNIDPSRWNEVVDQFLLDMRAGGKDINEINSIRPYFSKWASNNYGGREQQIRGRPGATIDRQQTVIEAAKAVASLAAKSGRAAGVPF